MRDGKLDNNTIIGFLLIGAILLVFSYFGESPKADEIGATNTEQTDSTAQANAVLDTIKEKTVAIQDTTAIENDSTLNIDFGSFGEANNPKSTEEFFTLENELLEIIISSKGGQIVKAHLKDYQTWDSLPLNLVDNNSAFSINLKADGETKNTNDLYFTGSKSDNGDLKMSLTAENGGVLEYTYHLNPGKYDLDVEVFSKNFASYLPEDAALTWQLKTFRHEKNIKAEGQVTELNYRFAEEDDVDYLSAAKDDEEQEANLLWVGYKQQFFSSILWSKNGKFEKAGLVSKVSPESDEKYTKAFSSTLSLPKSRGEFNAELGMYFGPNKYEILDSYEIDFDKLIPLGWGILGWINRGLIINMFNWLEGSGMGYGLIILIIALVIKLILFPLTFSSYKSMAKMRVLKPEIDELNEKFKDKDAMKKQQATMDLYRKAGVNPLGGCIPMLLQFPILIALFRFFPASIELRQQPFLWATDLSTYDSIYDLGFDIPFYGDHISLFTLLMTVSTLIYTYMNQQLTGQNQQYPQLKYMVYLMPIVFLGVFNNYAAGLSYYYFVANMITFGQQFAIRRYLNEEKILQKIQEKKKKPQKENRFARRMRELQEQQEAQQKNRQNRRKK